MTAWLEMSGLEACARAAEKHKLDGPATFELFKFRMGNEVVYMKLLAGLGITNPGDVLKLTALLRSFFEPETAR